MKKIIFSLTLLTLSLFLSCKEQNEDLIIGTWQFNNYYFNNVEATTQYADEQQYPCGGNTIAYTPFYKIESLEWEFKEDGSFKSTEIGKSYDANLDICQSGSKIDEYVPSDEVQSYEGYWSISDGGKGNQITLQFDGYYFSVDILSIGKFGMNVEYNVDGNTIRIDFWR